MSVNWAIFALDRIPVSNGRSWMSGSICFVFCFCTSKI